MAQPLPPSWFCPSFCQWGNSSRLYYSARRFALWPHPPLLSLSLLRLSATFPDCLSRSLLSRVAIVIKEGDKAAPSVVCSFPSLSPPRTHTHTLSPIQLSTPTSSLLLSNQEKGTFIPCPFRRHVGLPGPDRPSTSQGARGLGCPLERPIQGVVCLLSLCSRPLCLPARPAC